MSASATPPLPTAQHPWLYLDPAGDPVGWYFGLGCTDGWPGLPPVAAMVQAQGGAPKHRAASLRDDRGYAP